MRETATIASRGKPIQGFGSWHPWRPSLVPGM